MSVLRRLIPGEVRSRFLAESPLGLPSFLGEVRCAVGEVPSLRGGGLTAGRCKFVDFMSLGPGGVGIPMF